MPYTVAAPPSPGNSSSSLATALRSPCDAGDAVADLDDRADVDRLDLGLELLDLLPQGGSDIGNVYRHGSLS